MKKNGNRWQSSSIDFMKCHNIELQKSYTSDYAGVRYYAGNGLKLTSTNEKWTIT